MTQAELDEYLLHAFYYSNKENAEQLLKYGADISFTIARINPSIVAALDKDMLEIFIKHGNLHQELLDNIYSYSVAKGAFENAQLLKDAGAQSNSEIDFIEACHKGDLEFVKNAFDNGMNFNAGAVYGKPAISIAIRYPEILKLFIAHPECTQQVLDNALIADWDRYEYNMAKEEWEHKYDIPTESAELLLDAGANPNYKYQNSYGETEYVINKAVHHPRILEAFIESEKLTQETIDHGLSVIHKNSECVALLLNADADVNAKGALEMATQDIASLILFIIKGGIEKDTLNKALETSMDRYSFGIGLSEQEGFEMSEDDVNFFIKESLEAIQLLREEGAELTADMILNAAQNDSLMLKLFPSYYSQNNLDKALEKAMTIDWWMLHNDYGQHVKLLLDLGADVNTKDSDGEYVIKYAAKDPVLLVAFLEKGGVSVEAMKSTGFSVPEVTLLLLNQHKAEAANHDKAHHAEHPIELDGGMEAHEATQALH